MKVIIAGSRTFNDYPLLRCTLDEFYLSTPITEIVCGGAAGADMLGKQWAEENNIPVKMFDAQWHMYGKSAGMIRNIEMGEYADFLIAFWDGISPGTKHMIDYMKTHNKHGIICYFNKENN